MELYDKPKSTRAGAIVPGRALSRLSVFAYTLLALPLALALSAAAQEKKPNILVIFGDDIGQTNINAYADGVVGYTTPNIDRLAHEGLKFTDYYAEAARRGAHPSSPASRRSEPACRKSACRGQM